MKNNQKQMEQSFIESITYSMRLSLELNYLKKYVGDDLHLELEDFQLVKQSYIKFMKNLERYIKDNDLSLDILRTIHDQVTQINHEQLVEEYKKFSKKMSKDEYRALGLGVHLQSLEDKAEDFLSVYYDYTNSGEIAYDNKVLNDLGYVDFVKKPSSLMGAFHMWDMDVARFGKKESKTCPNLEIESV